jgi:altronate hydrolase
MVALKDVKSGESFETEKGVFTTLNDIPAGHKIAISNLNKNEKVIKYGSVIGIAKVDIRAGEWVHTHNMGTALTGEEKFQYTPSNSDKLAASVEMPMTFKGYKRKKGRAGIRNELWIIPMVGCVNGVAIALERTARRELDLGSFEDIIAFPHQFGCSQLGDDHKAFQRLLSNLSMSPNAGGVLFVALGCENNTIESFEPLLGDYDRERIRFMTCQTVNNEIEEGIRLIKEIISAASQDIRSDVSVTELTVGLKCGGSDGFSGITANPLIGRFSDLLIGSGGSAVLTEVPEMFGAESVLLSRAASRDIFNDFDCIIKDFKEYYIKNNQPVYETPSPGIKKGGITALEESSLGCVRKGGSSTITSAIEYGSRIPEKGLNVLSAPGNDLISSTALAAAGAQIVLFSTGRGTPFSTAVPTVKISSNSALKEKKSGWIDFNAGALLEGESMDNLAYKLYDYVINVASGERVKSEINGIKEIAFFKTGVTL